MKSVIQRVSRAEVRVADQSLARIGPGLMIFLSIGTIDRLQTVTRWAEQVLRLPVLSDPSGRLTRSLAETRLPVCLVSQFTLHARTDKGKRLSFSRAAAPRHAEPLFDAAAQSLRHAGITVQTGQFGAHMHVELINDGPVTIHLDVDER